MSETNNRIGDWMQIASGKNFWPLDPRPDEIEIEDIAAALSKLCRFNGHTNQFYSVAQHSVLVSRACNPSDALWGLLHDASEAYLGDVIRPLKRQACFSEYLTAEKQMMVVICKRFNLKLTQPDSVSHADEIVLATEARDLMGNDSMERWSSIRNVSPLSATVRGLLPTEAYFQFLGRFQELTQGAN